MTVKDWGEPLLVVYYRENIIGGDLVDEEVATYSECDWHAILDRNGNECEPHQLYHEREKRMIDCFNAFAGLDPADSVVVSREDLECALSALRDLIAAGRHDKSHDEPAYDRLTAAMGVGDD